MMQNQHKKFMPATGLTTVVLNYEELGRMAIEHVLNTNRRLSQLCRIQLMPMLSNKGKHVHCISLQKACRITFNTSHSRL